MTRETPTNAAGAVFGVRLDNFDEWLAENGGQIPVACGSSERSARYAAAQVVKVVAALRKQGVINSPSTPPDEEITAAQPRCGARPSFDEWFKAKHGGASFDTVYWQAGMMLADHVHALSREARAYLSEIAQGNHRG